jgi:nickel/cobalt exporter
MDLNRSAGVLLLGAFTIAALHALIPSHWLAFAIVGRAQRWTMRQTLRIVALAGAGHILMTLLLGLILATVGKTLLHSIPDRWEHAVTAGALILLGIYFAIPALRGRSGCRHPHHHDYHLFETQDKHRNDRHPSQSLQSIGSSPTVIGALVMGMTLSPCLDLLSIYIPAAMLSWQALVAVSLIMAITTLGIMIGLVWLTLKGLERLNLQWLEQNEGLAVGGTLIALGVLLLFIRL